MKTEVAIIGGGPSGLLLGQLLATRGIGSIVLERASRDHVLGRIRAGVLERGMQALMHEAGVGARMQREGFVHDGTCIAFDGDTFRLNFTERTGHAVMIYGQTEVTRDLYDARDASGARTVFGVNDVTIHDPASVTPSVSYTEDGQTRRIECDFIAGCDGFHGVSRASIPATVRRDYRKDYPFGWLGVLSETPPVSDELIYANAPEGFALCSMRNANLSRYYIQCSTGDRVEDWSDDAFWDELKRRLPADSAATLVTGPSIEKSIAPLRSFVTEPMQWGRLFLCGDAAHIVPPTGAKGLNTAASDVHYLFEGLCAHYASGDDTGLDAYSARALARVWKTQRFSWWFSRLIHRFPENSAYDLRMQRAEFDHLRSNDAAAQSLADNYVGLPY